MEKLEGKMIALYGTNNIGKTTQAKRVINGLRHYGKKALYLKYPRYHLKPEGPFLNQWLRDPDFRKKNPCNSDQLQTIYVLNRKRYQPTLIELLKAGYWVVLEDYVGTGIAWGLTYGSHIDFLIGINEGLRNPDLSILMDGERFVASAEENHYNESNDKAMLACRKHFLSLADRYHWPIVNANQDQEKVGGDIQEIITNYIGYQQEETE